MAAPVPGPAFASFAAASRAALEHLQNEHGLGLWMVTRTTGEDWVVLEAADTSYDIGSGDLFRWSDSFCSRMVRGEGPNVAADSAAVAVYAEAPIADQVEIGAYVGVPLMLADGSLFGTLCAIDPQPQATDLAAAGREAALLGQLLSTILEHELRADALLRRAEAAEWAAEADSLTGLPNRRAWDRMIEVEESRCRRYGVSAALAIIDLDGLKATNDSEGHEAGDRLLRHAAEVLRGAARPSDVVARIGGDEFGILLVDCDAAQARAVTDRLSATLDVAGVAASMGLAARPAGGSLADAIRKADEAMYEHKRLRRARS